MAARKDEIDSFNLSKPFFDRRNENRRAEDKTEFCSEHYLLTHKFETFFKKFEENDRFHEVRMGKLEKQIEQVDIKVDDLRRDIPNIIKTSVEDAFKTGVWIGIKKFFKILGGLALLTLATAIILTLAPDFAEFIQEIGNNIGR